MDSDFFTVLFVVLAPLFIGLLALVINVSKKDDSQDEEILFFDDELEDTDAEKVENIVEEGVSSTDFKVAKVSNKEPFKGKQEIKTEPEPQSDNQESAQELQKKLKGNLKEYVVFGEILKPKHKEY